MSPRVLSSAGVRALTAQETGEAFLRLVTITHPDFDPLYVVNNTVNIWSRGHEFLAAGFDIALPDEREDAIPTVELRIENIDRRIMEHVRGLTTTPSVILEVVLASSPDTLEAGPFTFALRGVDYDALLIVGTLAPEDVLNEPAQQYSFTPDRFPGLFP